MEGDRVHTLDYGAHVDGVCLAAVYRCQQKRRQGQPSTITDQTLKNCVIASGHRYPVKTSYGQRTTSRSAASSDSNKLPDHFSLLMQSSSWGRIVVPPDAASLTFVKNERVLENSPNTVLQEATDPEPNLGGAGETIRAGKLGKAALHE